ncbi:hypothetical protein GXB85_16475 [Cellulomonas sp. APG4]|uniref:hypothetical protein n=1 Tax=Cellulomonas sp. APG4 TaxID=1538656 RepID=UPI00137A5E4D|nr:hypothetical protein [Cellulomonas sp. APG4]NCT92533.1 hypothetical protein [Cellulomonas sp. APG4]
MRLRALAAVAAVCLLAGGLSTAQAASLAVAPSTLTTVNGQACTTSSLALTRTDAVWWGLGGFRGVRLTVPPACAGRALHVTAHQTGGSAVATGAVATLPTGSVDVAMSATYGGIFTSHALSVTIDGWYVATTG